MANQIEWAETWRLFRDLWQSADAMTSEQSGEWEARLRYLDQQKVRGAIRNVYAKVKYPKNPPALSDILYAYRALGTAQTIIPRATHGDSDADWYAIQREADQAREVLKALEPDDLERHKRTACRAMAFVRGYNDPPGDRHASHAHQQVATGLATQIVDDPDKWSSQFVLCVHGAMVLEFERQGVGAA